MESGLEQRIRDLLTGHIGQDGSAEVNRVELNGVTLVELRVERLVLVVDGKKADAA
jgi:hypothetical protein